MPEVKTFYEPCYGKGAISNILIEEGFDVINRDLYYLDTNGQFVENNTSAEIGYDFFDETNALSLDDYDVLFTNPPYQKKHNFLAKCMRDGKPYALLLPFQIFATRSFEGYGKDKKLRIVLFSPKLLFNRNGVGSNIGETVAVFGNFPVIETQERQYEFSIAWM